YILGYAAALLALSNVPGSGIYVDSFYIAVVVAIIWGILGWTVRPMLNLLALPITILTLGLFSFVVNALVFWFMASFIQGFHVDGFIPALIGTIVLSLVSWLIH